MVGLGLDLSLWLHSLSALRAGEAESLCAEGGKGAVTAEQLATAHPQVTKKPLLPPSLPAGARQSLTGPACHRGPDPASWRDGPCPCSLGSLSVHHKQSLGTVLPPVGVGHGVEAQSAGILILAVSHPGGLASLPHCLWVSEVAATSRSCSEGGRTPGVLSPLPSVLLGHTRRKPAGPPGGRPQPLGLSTQYKVVSALVRPPLPIACLPHASRHAFIGMFYGCVLVGKTTLASHWWWVVPMCRLFQGCPPPCCGWMPTRGAYHFRVLIAKSCEPGFLLSG